MNNYELAVRAAQQLDTEELERFRDYVAALLNERKQEGQLTLARLGSAMLATRK